MTSKTTKNLPPAILEDNSPPPPDAAEKVAIEAARQRVRARRPRIALEIRQDGDGKVELIGGGHSDHHGWVARLEDVFGTRGTAFAISQLNHLMTVARDRHGKIDSVKVNGMLAMIEGMRPASELEAALAVQAAVTHVAALTVTQRALQVDQIPQFDSAANTAVKLLRTFVLQAEALAKLQRGGEQIVKVVHVHPGGQAIVGNVTAGGAGTRGGGIDENGNQPHAKELSAAYAAEPMPQVRCEDQEWQPMPLSCRDA